MRILCLSLACAVAVPTFAFADAVDDYVEAQRAKQKIPGVSVAICRDGQVVKAAGYGLANVELDVPAKPETVFQSGSVGKRKPAREGGHEAAAGLRPRLTVEL